MSKIHECTRYRSNGLDGMLVIGGGSVMDSAKGVKFLWVPRKMTSGNPCLGMVPIIHAL